jgi:Uma2 family endonuclease
LHLGRDVLVPDLAGWRRARMAELPDAAYATLAPDWVCEVLSPSTASFDRVEKLAVHAREAVAHVWFVDPALQTLEVLRLDGPRWALAGSYAGNEVVCVEPFTEIGLELARLWSGPPSLA